MVLCVQVLWTNTKPLKIKFIDDKQIWKLNVIMKKHRVIALFLIQYLIKSQENTWLSTETNGFSYSSFLVLLTSRGTSISNVFSRKCEECFAFITLHTKSLNNIFVKNILFLTLKIFMIILSGKPHWSLDKTIRSLNNEGICLDICW